ncbi:MAG: putative acetyltransferase [Bacteroidetes bacterium]|nr:putative acetyltransferase [Bacteroidota bacterium]
MIGKGFRVEYPLRLLGGKDISIGNYFNAFGRLRLEAFDNHNGYKFSPEIIIGNNVSLNFDCHIGCINRIKIGDNVLIASRVSILDHSHGEISSEALGIPPSKRKIVSKGPIIIEDNVWIGEGAVILPNVIIGKNTIIGANSVVTKSFPANSVIGGIPAKLIKQL